MKKTLLIIVLLALMPLTLSAQKYACVNTAYILSNIPDYAKAQQQLDKLSEGWQKELEKQFADIEKLYKTYQQEAYLLPDNLKKKRQDEITAKEKEARDLQNQYFGAGGDLDKKRAELMKPIQDRVYNAIERIANEKNYAFILDKSGSATLLFVNAKYDVSDQVLDLLGYKATPPAGDSGAAKSGERGGGERKRSVDNPEMRRPDR